jgi:tetratricopeptide (TPR) repeat protein
LFLVNTRDDLEDHLRDGLTVCEKTLALYHILDLPDWQGQPEWLQLGGEDQQRLAEDARELLLLLAGARVRLAPHDPATLAGALKLLDNAAGISGLEPCRALWEDREAYYRELNDDVAAENAHNQARAIEPRTARDHYLLAMTYSRKANYTEAIAHLDESLRINRRHYWSLVQRGQCHLELGDPVMAAVDFGNCVGLEPDFAWGHFNLGYAEFRCGRFPEALAKYTQALRCDPNLVIAYVNRGMLRLEQGEARTALDDFDEALRRGRDDAFLHSGRAVALERLGRSDEADTEFAAAKDRGIGAESKVRNRLRWVYGFAVAARLPDQAWRAFQAVLNEDPKNPQALYGCGMLLQARGDSDEAMSYYNRALLADPSFNEARRYRAVLLARTGRLSEAKSEIDRCSDRNTGPTLYAAACVAALASDRDEREIRHALDLLQSAFQRGYGRDKALSDPDLKNLLADPEFRRLVH